MFIKISLTTRYASFIKKPLRDLAHKRLMIEGFFLKKIIVFGWKGENFYDILVSTEIGLAQLCEMLLRLGIFIF